MPVVAGNKRTASFRNNNSNCCESRRIKVFDSRRKQRWVDPILTPPRSPSSPTEEIPDPVLDDIFELWDGAGLDELEDILTDKFERDMNVASALSELDMGFDHDFLSSSPMPFPLPPGDSISEDEEDQLLDRLLTFVSEDSPPPTNPPSPPGELDNNYSSSSSCNSSQFEEGFIGEDLINEQPDIFDNPIINTDTRISLATNIFEEDLEMKHDCMWSDHSSYEQHHRDELIKEFGDVHVKIETEDDSEEIEMKWTDTFNHWSEDTSNASSSSSTNSSSPSTSNELKYDDEAEMIRLATFNDHSYANPYPSDMQNTVKIEKNSNLSNCCSNNKKNHKNNRTIQGIVIKEEPGSDQNGGTKKTKILVPLKDLMESLQQKTFYVAPLGPGKKVIRLTGSETVKGMLGVHTSHLKHSRPMLSNHSHVVNNKIRMKKIKTKLPKERIIRRQDLTPESPSSSTSSTSSSPVKPKKTKTHNNMERLRRIDLRNSFDNLKKLVPVLSKSAKCSKVEILRRAEEYVRGLRTLEKRLVREEASVRSRNEALKLKLAQAQVQSQCA